MKTASAMRVILLITDHHPMLGLHLIQVFHLTPEFRLTRALNPTQEANLMRDHHPLAHLLLMLAHPES